MYYITFQRLIDENFRVFDWEYLNAPPNKNDPSEWTRLMKKC